MISPNSRYQAADRLFARGHGYATDGQTNLDDNGKALVAVRDTTYMLSTLPLPTPPPDQYITNVTDTLDILAAKQLQDSQKWWVIADANPAIRYPFDLPPGTTLNMPT